MEPYGTRIGRARFALAESQNPRSAPFGNRGVTEIRTRVSAGDSPRYLTPVPPFPRVLRLFIRRAALRRSLTRLERARARACAYR